MQSPLCVLPAGTSALDLGPICASDPGRVLDVIAALGADVVVLQEADFRMGARPSALPRDGIVERTGLEPLPTG